MKIISNVAKFIGVILVITIISAGIATAADDCRPDNCTFVADKKGALVKIEVLPDLDGNWPIEITEATTIDGVDITCGADDYPCLAWTYTCAEDNCEKITKESILISKCCDKPIDILDFPGEGGITDCSTADNQSRFPNVCSGFEIRITSNSGNTPGELLFWFTTPKDVGTGIIDVSFDTGAFIGVPCETGIKGPGCTTPLPPVRVEPRVQCYQFTAETDCSGPQTWYAEWDGSEPCAVDVYAAQWTQNADGSYNEVGCDEVKNPANLLTAETLGNISIEIEKDGVTVYQTLTEALTNNSQCDEGWLRFVDEDSGCNVRCYYSGGRRYCF